MQSTVSPQWKGSLMYEGYRYRRDRMNRDGSMSLRCIRRHCAGRIKKLADETIEYVTPHSHESYVVSHVGKMPLLFDGYRYRQDTVCRDGSVSLRCVHRDCAGRIKKLMDGTTYCVTPHRHFAHPEKEAVLHEGYDRYANVNENSSVSLQTVGVTTHTHVSHSRSVLPQQGKVAWLYEGYHYRCDKINGNGSLSLCCIRNDCAGRINKFVDGTTDYITPHSHESCTTVSQGKENKASLFDECHYQHDTVNQDSSVSLQEVNVTDSTPESCFATVVPQQGKGEAWLHEGCRYRHYRVNQDGSLSFRCMRRGCPGRIKKLADGTTVTFNMHNHPPELINTETENKEADIENDNALDIKSEPESIESDAPNCDEITLLQSMIQDGFEFDLLSPSYSSQQTVEKKRKQDYISDDKTSPEIHTAGICEVIMLKPFLHYIIGLNSTKCCHCCVPACAFVF